MKILVLGAGRVGRVIAEDLAQQDSAGTFVADISSESLTAVKHLDSAQKLQSDLSSSKKISELIQDFDLIVNALPGSLGFAALKVLVEQGKKGVDIAFFVEDALPLHEKAKATGACVVYDCGVAPGMSNMIVGRLNEEFDSLSDVEIYVGGLPLVRTWPYAYRAGFSPSDVIEEYVRPARLVVNGRTQIREALSDIEIISFPKIGALEAFNTDGLRSLADTIDGINMKEKTLRYPGHAEKMLLLRETGFFSDQPIAVGDTQVSPLALTSELLFEHWRFKEDEEDLTIMQVRISGVKNNSESTVVYDLFDTFDPATGYTSMSRTTGFTATAMVQLMKEGLFAEPGVHPPERVGANLNCFNTVVQLLEQKGVRYVRGN